MQPLTNSQVQRLHDQSHPPQSLSSRTKPPQTISPYRPQSGNRSMSPPNGSDINDSDLQNLDNQDISDLDEIDNADFDELDDEELEGVEDVDLEESQEEMEDEGKDSKGKSRKDLLSKQKQKEKQRKEKEKKQALDPMSEYEKKELEILKWCKEHPGELWTDPDFLPNTKQFFRDDLNSPSWASDLKNIEWKRPHEIHKDPKFMIEQEKGGKYIDCDAKQGLIAESWFIGVLTILAGRGDYISKLIVEKEFFNKGFVSFQFFKNGEWRQVIVDTVLPYEKESSSRTSVYSSCNNPQEFWISLIEKAYTKLHGSYERMCQGLVLDGFVDLTGGISEAVCLKMYEVKKMAENGSLWNLLLNNFNLRYYIGCINLDETKNVKTSDQGQQGILENHYYSLLDMKDFPKENLKLVRIRNPWGSDGLWNGAFCEDSDDWDKHRSLKNELQNVTKTNKSEGAWWMSFSDWCQQYSHVYISKIFPQAWESYSIEGRWMGKTNGGACPKGNDPEKQEHEGEGKLNEKQEKEKIKLSMKPKVRVPNKGFCPPKIKLDNSEMDFKKTSLLSKTKSPKAKNENEHPQYLQSDTDDKWFNNPQYKIKVTKDTKVYISLMLQDERLTNVPYIPYNFMIVSTKSKTERIWERPYPEDIILESNNTGIITDRRQVAVSLTLKRQQDKPYGIYMIIPNIIDSSILKKEEKKTFFLRIFASEPIDVVQMPQTLQTTVEDIWTEDLIKGRRKIDGKDNSDWCRNSQYFLNLKQPTQLKIILRKHNVKKSAIDWKIGMTVCRLNTTTKKITVEKIEKKISSGSKSNNQQNNLQRLLQQTNQYLQPPIMDNIQRKLFILPQQKFKQSDYQSSDVAALYYNLNPTQGPFIIIPSILGDDKESVSVSYRLTIFSNNPIDLQKLDSNYNAVLIGKWEKDLSAGGCHLTEREKEPSQRTWSQNPKYLLNFKMPLNKKGIEEIITEADVKITLAIAEKNWKKENPNTVGRMIGLYLMNRKEGKLVYNEDLIVAETNFLPTNINTLECHLGGGEIKEGEEQGVGGRREINRKGYIIMPSTYESKIQGSFILAVKSNVPFELVPIK